MVIAAMDPITGSGSMIGWLAVNVNANDVAVMGGEPRWFSTTLLIPEDASVEEVKKIVSEIHLAAKKLGVAVITGHSEITPGIVNPIIVGHMLGKLISRKPIRSSDARAGDLIVMVKTAGIEGTAILSTDFAEILKDRVSEKILERAKRFYRRISVVEDALKLAKRNICRSMHDPTEGGVLGGVYEVAEASKLSFILYEDKIPVAAETKIICNALNCDPLRLIASGALIASIPEENFGKAKRMIRGLRVIGRFRRRKMGNVLVKVDGSEEKIKDVVRDELWRLIEEFKLK
ncbi:MAG: hydrogenase [Thaumarchaeota archaeon]|nr:MAG: hydrogenase [Nitrososphaerota archaeon]